MEMGQQLAWWMEWEGAKARVSTRRHEGPRAQCWSKTVLPALCPSEGFSWSVLLVPTELHEQSKVKGQNRAMDQEAEERTRVLSHFRPWIHRCLRPVPQAVPPLSRFSPLLFWLKAIDWGLCDLRLDPLSQISSSSALTRLPCLPVSRAALMSPNVSLEPLPGGGRTRSPPTASPSPAVSGVCHMFGKALGNGDGLAAFGTNFSLSLLPCERGTVTVPAVAL